MVCFQSYLICCCAPREPVQVSCFVKLGLEGGSHNICYILCILWSTLIPADRRSVDTFTVSYLESFRIFCRFYWPSMLCNVVHALGRRAAHPAERLTRIYNLSRASDMGEYTQEEEKKHAKGCWRAGGRIGCGQEMEPG